MVGSQHVEEGSVVQQVVEGPQRGSLSEWWKGPAGGAPLFEHQHARALSSRLANLRAHAVLGELEAGWLWRRGVEPEEVLAS